MGRPKKQAENPTENPERITQESLQSNQSNQPDEKPKDYLQQYQYKKDVPLGHLSTNPPKGSKAEIMKQSLLSQPRVNIMIPKKKDDSDKLPKSFTLNGYRLDFPKGKWIEVPRQIFEMMNYETEQIANAIDNNPLRIDGNRELEAALA